MIALQSGDGAMEIMLQTARALLGANIARLAERQSYSLSGLAEHCGIPLPMASRWKRGTVLPYKYLEKIAEYFEVPIAELFLAPDAAKAAPEPKRITLDQSIRFLAEYHGYKVRRTRDPLKKT